MTVIDIILGQKLILLSAVFAVVPLLAALTLSLVARLKRNAAKRARAAARIAARKALIAAQEAELLAQAEGLHNAVAGDDASAAPPAAVAAAAAPVSREQESQDQPVAEEGSEQGGPESPEIQNILSSVFVDDEASAHLETLASELPEVEASLLVTMSAQIAQQMRAQHAPDAQS